MEAATLAGALASAGQRKRATALFKTLLPDYERILGPTHRPTVAVRNNLDL